MIIGGGPLSSIDSSEPQSAAFVPLLTTLSVAVELLQLTVLTLTIGPPREFVSPVGTDRMQSPTTASRTGSFTRVGVGEDDVRFDDEDELDELLEQPPDRIKMRIRSAATAAASHHHFAFDEPPPPELALYDGTLVDTGGSVVPPRPVVVGGILGGGVPPGPGFDCSAVMSARCLRRISGDHF